MSLRCHLFTMSADEAALVASGDGEMGGVDSMLANQLDLDTAWGGIHYLLTGSTEISEEPARPEDFLLSGARLDASEHLAVHTAEEVAQFAAVMKDASAEQLAQRFDAEQMNRLAVYGGSWTSSDKADLTESLAELLKFVKAAAANNQGMMIIIS